MVHCLMVIHPHTKYDWPILKDKKYGLDKFSPRFFTFELKINVGQGQLNVIMVRNTPSYGDAPTY